MSKVDNLKGKQVKFSSDNQPKPEAKSLGHKKSKIMLRTLEDYVDKLQNTVGAVIKQGDDVIELSELNQMISAQVQKAKSGDTKAFDSVMKFLQPITTKIDHTTNGKEINIPIIEWVKNVED